MALPPAATTSSAIKPPTNLKATDVPGDQGGSIALTWTTSTTSNIDGYKIFRSTAEKTGFTSIYSASPTATSYTDSTAKTNTQYYYFVRSYQGTSQSASSTTVNATAIDNLAPAAPQDFKIKDSTNTNINFTWAANTEKDLDGYILVITDPKQPESAPLGSADIAKNAITYSLVLASNIELKKDTNYNFYLQARDVNGNFSDKSVTKTGKFAISAATNNNESQSFFQANKTLILCGIGVIVLLLIFLLIYRLTRKKPKIASTPPKSSPIPSPKPSETTKPDSEKKDESTQPSTNKDDKK